MKRTVLAIEDNEQNLYLVSFLLEKYGYEVIAARDGAAGIATAKQHKPDLILLDIQLPLMDGYAVAGQLRDNPDLAQTPSLPSPPMQWLVIVRRRWRPAAAVTLKNQ